VGECRLCINFPWLPLLTPRSEAWLQSNINRLALTFGRPVIGVHNQTSGIIFDVVECLVQRNLGLATNDVREAYKIVKEKLYNPKYNKIVFILHSQGGIEGGLVLDWLLQELPQDLLAKLEVYTFGNAANHFNNPHRHTIAQEAQRENCANGSVTAEAITEIPISESPTRIRTPATSRQSTNMNGSAMAINRAIGYVEHYAHTTDFVALWGVLHFVTNERASPSMPRFIGRVFARTSSRGGHQFCQHYLDGMFPLEKDGNDNFIGCANSNEFMDSVVEAGEKGSEGEELREGIENSWGRLRQDSGLDSGVAVHESFHSEKKEEIEDGKVRVKDLSRRWQYRNGRSPPEVPNRLAGNADGVRVATF
jgi:hypothetical protein